MFEGIKRLIPDTRVNPKARLWLLVAAVGFVSMLAVGGVSVVRAILVATAGPIEEVPALELTTMDGIATSLDRELEDIGSILVLVPSCALCTRELQARVAMLESAPQAESERAQHTLLLVVREGGIAQASFMEAFNRLRLEGAKSLLIARADLARLGVVRWPAEIPVTAGGRLGEIRYP